MPRPVRLYILFGMLSVLTFAGPLLIFIVGGGGARPTWPPDRPIEWQVFLGVTIGYLLLFASCMIDGSRLLARQRRLTERRTAASGPDSSTSPGVES